jgi:hypothetical protein
MRKAVDGNHGNTIAVLKGSDQVILIGLRIEEHVTRFFYDEG